MLANTHTTVEFSGKPVVVIARALCTHTTPFSVPQLFLVVCKVDSVLYVTGNGPCMVTAGTLFVKPTIGIPGTPFSPELKNCLIKCVDWVSRVNSLWSARLQCCLHPLWTTFLSLTTGDCRMFATEK